MERINTVNGLTIDFERIRNIRQESEFLIIEYNARIEYSKNPFTGEIEKSEISESISKEFHSYESARDNHIDIKDYWNEYLTQKV
ncbi:hypothetical protein [Flavobacterium caeni]|uniref:hypothetical protein n=1 Tax=Flavobacterium caeni TaxID=490189 RepID=UPI00111320C5|nr:hypothetical protein [Flavobacterium caeni]